MDLGDPVAETGWARVACRLLPVHPTYRLIAGNHLHCVDAVVSTTSGVTLETRLWLIPSMVSRLARSLYWHLAKDRGWFTNTFVTTWFSLVRSELNMKLDTNKVVRAVGSVPRRSPALAVGSASVEW